MKNIFPISQKRKTQGKIDKSRLYSGEINGNNQQSNSVRWKLKFNSKKKQKLVD